MVLRVVASRSSSKDGRGRGGPPLGLLGLAALVALVAAYLSDCIPGLGAGGSLGVPETKAPAEPAEPAAESPPESKVEEADAARISIEVKGDKCRQGSGSMAPCPEVCAGLDRSNAASMRVEVDASSGRHGAVEVLRSCLQEAGFVDVRVRSE